MSEDIHWQKYAARFKTHSARITGDVTNSNMVVCIPVYAEPHLLDTLESLYRCELPKEKVDVLLLFNRSDRMEDDELILHDRSWKETLTWINSHFKKGLSFFPLYVDEMPDPTGGVGWARKLVMDEAARRLDQHGVILCLDADCVVEENYLCAVHEYFSNHDSCDAASIYFEHPLNGLTDDERKSIVHYELHLRYLVHALRWAGHPFAFHTVGSSMAVRRKAYLAQGGMNTRKAGEDFYFLHKFIETGSLHEIKTTTVYPSARMSFRVPFGTGKAMSAMLLERKEWRTPSPFVYQELKLLIAKLRLFYPPENIKDKASAIKDALGVSGLGAPLQAYLKSIGFVEECAAIASHTGSITAFTRRFFRYFNAFRVIKYTHWMRDAYYPDVPVIEAAEALKSFLQTETPPPAEDQLAEAEGYLALFRQMDKA